MAPMTACKLPDRPLIDTTVLERVGRDYDRFARGEWPHPIEEYLAENYRLDVTADYAGIALKNPWGKASGQLSMTMAQVAEDVAASLGFIVLKTVIAQDPSGARSMQDWAIRESRMAVEPIIGRSGEPGWTVSWKGRGWWQTFDDYLELIRAARRIALGAETLIVPSCKFHLPAEPGEEWRTSEYDFTVGKLLEAWRSVAAAPTPMPLEKDFSPTLAGSNLARQQEMILSWLRSVPRLITSAASRGAGESASKPVRVGLKIFNALADDSFQVDMLRAIHDAGEGSDGERGERPDYFVYANRLFDPTREFDGCVGIAYGGPDLSERNLRTLDMFRRRFDAGEFATSPIPWSATGNITTGRMAVEYALRGASSFQLHTFFQLPSHQFRRVQGTRTEKALHELYFHPETGFIVWLHHAAKVLGLPSNPIRFREIVGRGGGLHASIPGK